MAFQFQRFLRERGIPFVEAGHNVASGHINIKCPFCGTSDRSEHLGINLTTQKWACWRESSHCGSRPHRLVMALLGCTYERAAQIVGDSSVELSEFDSVVAKLRGDKPREPAAGQPRRVELPRGCVPLGAKKEVARRARDYLQRRGFEAPERLGDLYGLRVGELGKFRDRIVIPVELQGCGLVTYTARAIARNASLRYLTPKTVEGVTPIKDTVWNHADLMRTGGRTLMVVEGPFDALKLDYYGDPAIRATALFGLAYTEEQLALLAGIASRFRRLVVMFDPGATAAGLRLCSALADLNAEFRPVPPGVEDPGALSKNLVGEVKKGL